MKLLTQILSLFSLEKKTTNQSKAIPNKDLTEIDLSFNNESSEKGCYLIFSLMADSYNEDKVFNSSVGYVLLDSELKCINSDFRFFELQDDLLNWFNPILSNSEYLISFNTRSIAIDFFDLGFNYNPDKVVSLMEEGAEFVGIPHPTKNEFKWPKLYELAKKLFSPSGHDISYNKSRDGESKLYAKMFIKMKELDLIKL